MKIFLKVIFKWASGILVFAGAITLIIAFLLIMGLAHEQIDNGLNIFMGVVLGLFVLICIYQEYKELRKEEKKNRK